MRIITFILMAFALTIFQCTPLKNSSIKRADNIIVESFNTFQLKGDSFYIDTLILKDGAGIVLDKKYRKAVIRANFFRFGDGSFIDGSGAHGKSENLKNGAGVVGHSGSAGVDLLFYCAKFDTTGSLVLNLKGGNGAPGAPAQATSSNLANSPSLTSPTRPYAGNAMVTSGIGTGKSDKVYSRSLDWFPRPAAMPSAPRTVSGEGGPGGSVLISIPEDQKDQFKARITLSNEGGYSANENQEQRIQAPDGGVKIILTKK